MTNAEQIDALVREVHAGRMVAFDTIVRETVPVIRSVVHFLIADKDLADDVVQDAYILIYQKIKEYTPGTNFLAWVKAIARNQALSARFRRQRKQKAAERYRNEVVDLITQDFVQEDQDDPIEEQLLRLRKCLSILQAKARSMVESRYFKSQSMDDLANEFGMNPSAVTVSLHRIRLALHKCMDNQGVQP